MKISYKIRSDTKHPTPPFRGASQEMTSDYTVSFRLIGDRVEILIDHPLLGLLKESYYPDVFDNLYPKDIEIERLINSMIEAAEENMKKGILSNFIKGELSKMASKNPPLIDDSTSDLEYSTRVYLFGGCLKIVLDHERFGELSKVYDPFSYKGFYPTDGEIDALAVKIVKKAEVEHQG